MSAAGSIITPAEPVLVTGAAGFIGARMVKNLLERGCRKVRCLVRPSANLARLHEVISNCGAGAQAELLTGNLLSRADCRNATEGVAVIYHLAAGTGTKSFSDAYLNSVVTTRNLLEAALEQQGLKRFVSLSSLAVYTNRDKPSPGLLDESCPMEDRAESRAEAYCYAKVKQDELVMEYGRKRGLPYVLLRPGVVYGPGKKSVTGRVGIDSFGIFLHLGGGNRIPFVYVDNCAEAVVLAGLKPGIDGEVFNVIDDDLPSSREFLRLYKRNVRRFTSIYLPHSLSYLLCYLWEKYCQYSQEQLPPFLSRREWAATWKRTRYSNEKMKRRLGWSPKVKTADGLRRFFEACRQKEARA